MRARSYFLLEREICVYMFESRLNESTKIFRIQTRARHNNKKTRTQFIYNVGVEFDLNSN